MNKIFRSIAFLMMILLTSAGKAATDFTEGVHYQKLGTSIKNLSDSKKVEIVELFWYGCPHCFEFEPILKEWIFENKTKVNLIQVPAVFSKNWIPHAKAFYSAYNIGHFDTLHQNLFKAIHIDRKKIYTKSRLSKFAAEIGIPEEEFKKSYGSFKTEMQVKKAMTITKSSGIQGVPAIVVGGVYVSSPRMAGSYGKLIEIIDFLHQKVSEK